jgi:hypothetical protein
MVSCPKRNSLSRTFMAIRQMFLFAALIVVALVSTNGFMVSQRLATNVKIHSPESRLSRGTLKMNFFEDAMRFFTNMKKEASAKHILIKGAGAVEKLNVIKAELVGVEDLSGAFSELASKV